MYNLGIQSDGRVLYTCTDHRVAKHDSHKGVISSAVHHDLCAIAHCTIWEEGELHNVGSCYLGTDRSFHHDLIPW